MRLLGQLFPFGLWVGVKMLPKPVKKPAVSYRLILQAQGQQKLINRGPDFKVVDRHGEVERAARSQDAMNFGEHRKQVGNVFQHAVGKDSSVKSIGFRDGRSRALNQFPVNARLIGFAKLLFAKVDSGVDRVGKEYAREQPVAAAQIENGTLKTLLRKKAALERALKGERQGRAGGVVRQEVGTKKRIRHRRNFKRVWLIKSICSSFRSAKVGRLMI